MSTDALIVTERTKVLEYSFEDLMRYHGPGSPGGVAHAFKVLERALPILSPDSRCERREISIETSFGGPGARDAFEMVTRAVSGERFTIDASLARPALGRARERFVFRLGYRGRTATLVLRDGFVTEAFIDLARTRNRSPEQEADLDRMKLEMAERVMAHPGADVYDAEREDALTD
jgi:hypothetical protein